MDIALDSSTGYILEVDLEYQQHLHLNAHTDLPFCSDARQIARQAAGQCSRNSIQ